MSMVKVGGSPVHLVAFLLYGSAAALSTTAPALRPRSPSSSLLRRHAGLCFQTSRHLSEGRPLRDHRGHLACSASSSAAGAEGSPIKPDLKEPKAKEIAKPCSVHGEAWEDPYAWMKDDNWQQVLREPHVLRQDIRDHLEEENAYMKAVMAPTEKLQRTIQEEMTARLQQDESGVPSLDGPYGYFRRYEEGNEHPIFCRISRSDFEAGVWTQDSPLPPSHELLLDANALAANLTFFNLGSAEHSPNHKLMAYSTDTKGSEYYTIEVKNLEDGSMLSDALVNASGSVAWSSDSQYVFYTMLDENHREKWVYRHKLGTAQAEDALVYEEPDDGFFVGVGVTDSQQFITIESNDHATSEIRIVPADKPESAPLLIQAREEGVQYDIQDFGDTLLILTNKDKAVDFKIATAPLTAPGSANWQDLIPHTPGVLIKSISVLKGHLLRSERVDALPRIVVASCAEGASGIKLEGEEIISFPEDAFSLTLRRGYEFDTEWIRFGYSSPTTPESCFDYNLSSKQRLLRKVQQVPSGHEPSDYRCVRKTATSHDGAKVPVTIMHRKDTPLDGSAPLLLYGYGSYGASMPAGFSTTRLSLVDRGVVFAIAHVRGGTDCGYAWYDPAGKTMQKKNTFLDFIAAAEFLVEDKFTSAGRIAILGRSAGGMLVGSTMNMAPKGLLAAVVGEVPFVDVLNTMLDTSLPLTPPEWPEWGNPIESKAAFDYIRSYAPYEQIEAKEYPHLLATAGLTDPRVTYWEPAKWVAKVRELRTNKGHLSLLKTDMGAGHAGKSGRFVQLEDEAFIHAFVLYVFFKIGALPSLDL